MKTVTASVCALFLAALSAPGHAAEDQTFQREGFTLQVQDLTNRADPAQLERMADTFFAVYPRLVADFNPAAPRTVTFIVDGGYEGVAGTIGDRILFDPEYLAANPADIDVVTHELMHVVQSYPADGGPGWITEGIADYVRDQYGVDNAAARWRLNPPTATQTYTQGYGVTAAFLLWLERNGHPGLVRDLDGVMRQGAYDDAFWSDRAGKPAESLWIDYVAANTMTVRRVAPGRSLSEEQIESLRQLSPEQIDRLRTLVRGTPAEARLEDALRPRP